MRILIIIINSVNKEQYNMILDNQKEKLLQLKQVFEFVKEYL